jgi:hypothetical protein
MSLRYSFRHLFFGGKLRPKRLYKILEDLDNATGGEALDISELEEVVGDSTGGLVKDVADLKTDKADTTHSHTLTNVTDLSTVEATVTYTDTTTGTLLLVVQTQAQSESNDDS